MKTQSVVLTPYENFIYALEAKETKRQYPHRLDKFLTFLNLQGTIPEKCSNALTGSMKEKIEIPSIFWRKAS
jgi:predicted phosphoadenosine phosphosulfate sulfurtransferase